MPASTQLPDKIVDLLSYGLPPETTLEKLMPLVAQTLQADRCFLHIHHPALDIGKIAFCWCKEASIPNVLQQEWDNDTATLPQQDPLFAAALRKEPSIFVEDVEKAGPSVLNLAFEDKTFGHRALIHAHIVQEEKLWGILQPAIFGRPRHWSVQDRLFIETLLPKIAPTVVNYVKQLKF